MKRNIYVNDKELIERLNRNLKNKKYEKPNVYVWDNNGPVQFDTQEVTDAKEKKSSNYTTLSDTYGNNKDKDTQLRTPYFKLPDYAVERIKNIEKQLSEAERRMYGEDYEEVNHPDHYNQYDVEVIDMMERIFGKEETAIFCKLNAFKYRQRMGLKPGQDVSKDLAKEKWYLDKKRELEQK